MRGVYAVWRDLRLTSKPRHSGVTLLEILMVMGVIAVLLALLLPAISASRQAAWRVACQVNLRGWVQATQAFVVARQHFPPAATWRIGEAPDGRPVPPRHSVFTYLLPYVDEVSLGASIDLRHDWNSPQNDAWTHVDLAGIFLCPATPHDRTGKQVTDYTTAVRVDPSETTGIGSLLRQGLVRNRSGQVGPRWGNGAAVWDGALQLDQIDYVRRKSDRRIVRPRDVSDGMSKTALYFENAGKPVCYRYGQRADCQITRFRWASPTIWLTLNDVCGGQQLVNCHNNSQPYAFHPGGLFFGFADGSVRFLPTDVAADVLVSFLTAAGHD